MNTNTYEENKELKSNILGISYDFPEYSQLWLITRLDNEVNETGKLPEPELLERLNNCLSSLNESDEVTKKIDMLSFKDMTRILNLWEEKVIRPIENQPITNVAIEYPDFSCDIIELNDEIKLAKIDIDNVEKFCSFYDMKNHCPNGFSVDKYCELNTNLTIYALLDKENKKQYVILAEEDNTYESKIYFKTVPNLYDIPDNIKNFDIDNLIASIYPARSIRNVKTDITKETPESKTGIDFFNSHKLNKILSGDNQFDKFKAVEKEFYKFHYNVIELENGFKTVILNDESTNIYNLVTKGIDIPEKDKNIDDKLWNPEKNLFFIINDKSETLATLETTWQGMDTEIDSVHRFSDKDKETVDRILFDHMADLSNEGFVRNLENITNDDDVLQFGNSLDFYKVLAEGHMNEKENKQDSIEGEIDGDDDEKIIKEETPRMRM